MNFILMKRLLITCAGSDPKTPANQGNLRQFRIGSEQADTVVGRLSGGQKARLSLLLATLDAPFADP